MITQLTDGKFQVTWAVGTVRLPNGHTLQGRPGTLSALTGTTVAASGEVRKVSSNLAECERQL